MSQSSWKEVLTIGQNLTYKLKNDQRLIEPKGTTFICSGKSRQSQWQTLLSINRNPEKLIIYKQTRV